MFGRYPVDVEEAHLFGLQIGDRRALSQRVQVVISQSLTRSGFGPRALQSRAWHSWPRYEVVSITQRRRSRDQQRLRIIERGTARIGEGDPALNVDLRCGFVEEG